MNADTIISAGSPLPRIARATARDQRKVEIVWADGRQEVVDLMPALASRRIYKPLRENDALFATLRVSEYGDAIEWDGDLDFSAVWIDRLTPVEFGNAEFRDAMDALRPCRRGLGPAHPSRLEIRRSQIRPV
jgi:hypothetical protein